MDTKKAVFFREHFPTRGRYFYLNFGGEVSKIGHLDRERLEMSPFIHLTASSGISSFVTLADIKNPDDSLFVIDIVKNPVVSDFKTVLGRILIHNERRFNLGFPGRAGIIG